MVKVIKKIKLCLIASCGLFTMLSFASCKDKPEDVEPKNFYTITFKNYDGSILKTYKNVEEGTLVEYDGETPSRPEDEEYTYTFVDWDKPITPATCNETYTAFFTSVSKSGGESGDIGDLHIGDWDGVE